MGLLGKINSNMGFQTRLNNGVPEWSAWGADTWSPFKNTNIKYIHLSTANNATVNVDFSVFCNNVAQISVSNFRVVPENFHTCTNSGAHTDVVFKIDSIKMGL